MSSLPTLLKIAQRRLDELGLEAAKLTQALAEADAEVAALLRRERAELEAAATDPMLAGLLPAYRRRVQLQISALKARRDQRELELSALRQRLQAAYIEKSKFEQLIEQRAQAALEESTAREQAALDEAAINRAG